MSENDPFSRELQRRSGDGYAPGGGLLPEALAELDVAIEELSVTGEELRAQTDGLASTRRALEAERERYRICSSRPRSLCGHRPAGPDPRGQPGGGGPVRGRAGVPDR